MVRRVWVRAGEKGNGMEREADVVIVGGGIVGTAILAALTRYDLKCLLTEKEPDIAVGTTKANSAVLHAGFDAPTGSLKAQMNVRGNHLYHVLQSELNLDIQWTGSLVVARTAQEEGYLAALKERGEVNGVPGLELWDSAKVLQRSEEHTSELQSR